MKKNIIDSWKYNEDGFFSLEGYLNYFNKNWRTMDWIFIVNAPRNIGKSYGVWAYIEWLWDTFKGKVKIAYCRTNGEKMKHARENFNARFRGKYYMNESKIYKQTFDEKGKEIMSLREEYGSVIQLNQSENYKSGFFENHQLFFWDEYNEVTAYSEQYEKFLDVLKTVKRKTTPFHVILVGNKVNESNDILHNLQVDLDDITNTKEDYFLWINKQVYYCEIGNDTFKMHNPDTDLVNMLAGFNKNTNAYLNEGTYLNKRSGNLILFDKYVAPTNEVFCYFVEGDKKYEFGDFYYKDEADEHVYFHRVDNIPKNALTFALDVIGNMRDKNTKGLDSESREDLANLLFKKAKQQKLWYCEHDTKLEIEYFIKQMLNNMM